jgi:hypothetical protein
MDDTTLRKALAMLRSFGDNLPDGHIEEKYIVVYHGLLKDLAQETGHDFTYFQVPDSELHHRVLGVSGRIGYAEPIHSQIRYCDRPMLVMKLQGVLNFLGSFLSDSPAKRIIGFTQPE